ncbi:hypothetical protein VNI00_009565 [Paramarasmius palmivorus]|uniref:DUF6534 domain-containing protein n=1 Tax=Paramarasmius palmivorus TaxID=297713 RepID=A0AAW0CQ11_9AGAR
MISNFTKPLVFFNGDVVWTLLRFRFRLFLVLQQERLSSAASHCEFGGVRIDVWSKDYFSNPCSSVSNHNLPLTALIVVLSFGQFGLAITYTVKSFGLKKLMYASRLKLIATLALGTGALTDVITAFTLSFYLRKLRTGYKKSDLLVNKLSLYAINTGALTSVLSLGALIFYNVQPTTFQFLAFYFTLSKLYAISLMCTLNTRKVVCGQGTDRELSTQGTANQTLPRFIVSHHSRNSHSQPPFQTKSQLEVGIHHEVSVVSDVGTDSLAQPKVNTLTCLFELD